MLYIQGNELLTQHSDYHRKQLVSCKPTLGKAQYLS